MSKPLYLCGSEYTSQELKDMTAPKIFLLNGPPRSGKDTLANYLVAEFPCSKVGKFAAPLKRGAAAFYGMTEQQFKSLDSSELKDTPTGWFLDKTPREVQIGLPEVYAKNFHQDKAVFGKILANTIDEENKHNCKDLFFISDSGFVEEGEALVDRFGAENVFLFRLLREGTSFKGDSRSYISLTHRGVMEWEIENFEDRPGVMFETVRKIVADVSAAR